MRNAITRPFGVLTLVVVLPSLALAAATPATSIPVPVPAAKTTNIHASANFPTTHQHYFNNATAKMVTASGDSLYVWVYLDARNPPAEVMLQWFGAAGWTRAWWGPADLIGWGGSQRSTLIPATGQWVQLKVPCSALGNPGTIQGLAFTLYGGMAYWGEAGYLTNGNLPEHMWVGNTTPAGAALNADNEKWNWIPYHRRNWRQMGGDSAHTNNNTSEFMIGLDNAGFLGALSGFTTLPPANVPDLQPVFLMNVAFDGVPRDVFYGSRSGVISAFDAYTGAVLRSRANGYVAGLNTSPISAPAIDPGSNDLIYSVGKDGCLHKYSTTTLEDYFGPGPGTIVPIDTPPDSCRTDGWPALLSRKPSVESTRTAVTIGMFNTKRYAYLGTGPVSHDFGDYQGSITAIDLGTGSQKVFNALCSDQPAHLWAAPATPNCGNPAQGTAKDGGGVWARGGVTFDWLTQRLYFSTGNALNVPAPAWSPNGHSWPMSVLALNPDGSGSPSGGGLPVDNFTPREWERLNTHDLEMGSTNTMILANNGSPFPHLAAQSGKDGLIRMINLDNMNGTGAPGNAGDPLSTFAIHDPFNTGCDGESCKVRGPLATWINPADSTTWVFALAQVGLNGMQLAPGSAIPSGNGWFIPQSNACANSSCRAGLTIANGVLYFADDNHLYAANPTTGAILATLGGGATSTGNTPVVVNGVLYFRDGAYTVGSALPPANLPSYNVALGNATNQQGWPFNPFGGSELGNDENIDPLWADHSVTHGDNQPSNVGGNVGGPWWKVDTPGQHTINQVVIYNRADGVEGRLGGFRILYRTGSTWQVASDQSGYATSFKNPVIPVSVNIVNPASVMVQLTHSGTENDWLHLAEVRVIGN